MSWSRSTISTCRLASRPLNQHFSTSASANKKFKPQDLYLLPGQPKLRKSKVPKKVLAWRAAREGLPAESTSAEADPVALFAEELEIEGRQRRRRRAVGEEEEEAPFGLKPKASFGFGVPREPEEQEEQEGGLPFGIDPRAAARQGRPETRMHQRVRETRESLVDLDKPRSRPPPTAEVHPDTVIPSWKIPTPSEYEKYARKKKSPVGRERRPDEGRRRDSSGWSDEVDPRTDRRRRESPNRPLSRHEQETTLAAHMHTSSNQTDTPAPPIERNPARWEPTKKISIPAMQGLRALHQSDPKTFSHAVLSEKFGVSREAVARIIRSRFRDEQ